jgi:hypothetical protein
MEAERNL